MAALWQARRWRRLLNLIDHLGQGTHYAEAITSDEEMAEHLAAAQEAAGPARPRMSQWTPEVAELTVISDRLHELIAVFAGKRFKPKQRPRPETAADRYLRQARIEQHQRLVARLLPEQHPN